MNLKKIVRVIGVAIAVTCLAHAPVSAALDQQGQQGQGQGQQGQGQQGQGYAAMAGRVALKIVVDKMEKERVTTSIPFDLMARPGRGQTTLNHGKSVAIPQTSTTREGATQTSYSYMSIGSNLSVGNMQIADNLITFELMLDISGIDPTANPALPASQNFRKVSFQSPVSVRPNEATQVSLSTDLLTGETVRVTVTATIVK